MNHKDLLEKLLRSENLSYDEARSMMDQLMNAEFSQIQMAGLLVALRAKGESVDEISACASVMREKATQIPVKMKPLIDTCGTGGDASGSFNISTTVALLLAGGGYHVAKHGNRSMTSKSGSADLLEALDVNLNLNPNQVAASIEQNQIGFL